MKHKRKLVSALILAAVAAFIYQDSAPLYSTSERYDGKSGRFLNTLPVQKVKAWIAVSSLVKLTFANSQSRPGKALPSVKPDWSLFTAAAAHSRFVWFGHSSLLMRVGEQNVLIDPLFGPSASSFSWMFTRFQAAPATLNALPEVDTILISHNHYDHLEESTMKYFITRQAHYIVPLGVGKQLQNWGVPADRITELDWYQDTTRQGVRYTAVPARHGSARSLFDTDKTLWAGWVIERLQNDEQQGEKIFYSGDSGYGTHFSEIGQRFNGFDIAFVENGQYDVKWPDNHMQPEQTVQAALDLQAKRFVPVHWGMFSIAFHGWNEPIKQSVPLARSKGLDVITPMLGQVFDQNSDSQDWWLDTELINTKLVDTEVINAKAIADSIQPQ